MSNRLRISFTMAMFSLLAFAALAQQPEQASQSGMAPQVIEMTAKKFEFDPAAVHVKAGAKIELKITATDHTHGFKINPVAEGSPKDAAPGLALTGNKECYKIKKGETVTVEIVAKTPGTYSFACCKLCGMGHKRMKGQLIVDPS